MGNPSRPKPIGPPTGGGGSDILLGSLAANDGVVIETGSWAVLCLANVVVVENMRSWEHSGFSVDQSVLLPAGDQAGIERLVHYMTRCPFSLSRLVKVSDTGQIVYQAEKQACRAFPDPKGDGTQAGVPRNFQILPPLDFLAEFTQHIPPKGSHLISGHRPKVGRGWYSNKSRGMRKKAEVEASAESLAEDAASVTAATRCSQTWAMLIKRVYEVDPLCCPECGGEMKVVSFIEHPVSTMS